MPHSTILITGCSSGIGKHAALALKERGYRVFATARKQPDVDALSTQGLESILLDVNDTASMHEALNTLLQKTNGQLDALFNNAGYLQAGAFEDLSRNMDRAQFETNVFGPVELTRLVLPIMRKQGHGRIIQNSSILGVITMPYYSAYNASKFALEGYSNTLRQELRGTNIHVSILNPGPIESKLREKAYQHFHHTLKERHSHIHDQAYQRIEENYFHPNERDKKVTNTPDAVIKKLIHALESPHPKAHYFVGGAALSLSIARRILPDFALDWLLNKIAKS